MRDSNYCVYLHKSKETGEVFYVGKGRPNRPYESKGRSSAWKDYVDNNGGFEVEILKDSLTNKEATTIEANIISSGEYALVNILKSHIVKEGILDVVGSFEYDENSPTFLLWKTPLFQSNKKPGDVAGSIGTNGYGCVHHKGRTLKIHRAIWVMHNMREIPEGMVINHIDCNPSNNAISNLECVTIQENNQRSKMSQGILSRSNSSGINGVSKLKVKPNDNSSLSYHYVAHYRINNKTECRAFAIGKYGDDVAKDMAISWREAMVTLVENEEFGNCLLESFDKKYGDLLKRDFPEGVFVTNDGGYDLFIAHITNNKNTKRRKFAINKYGYDEAYRLACEWRKQMEELYYK